jgi:hypothetical protein
VHEIEGAHPSLRTADQPLGVEECKPDQAEDQERQSGRDGKHRKHGWSGFSLPGFGRGLDDLLISSGCHGASAPWYLQNAAILASSVQRPIRIDVPASAPATG